MIERLKGRGLLQAVLAVVVGTVLSLGLSLVFALFVIKMEADWEATHSSPPTAEQQVVNDLQAEGVVDQFSSGSGEVFVDVERWAALGSDGHLRVARAMAEFCNACCGTERVTFYDKTDLKKRVARYSEKSGLQYD